MGHLLFQSECSFEGEDQIIEKVLYFLDLDLENDKQLALFINSCDSYE